MFYGRAMAIGMLGATVMTAMLALTRAAGMDINLAMMLGTMTGLVPGIGAWVLGFVMHLIAGGVFALIYAVGFEYLTHRAGWAIGVGFAAIHTVFSGLMMGIIPAIHPQVPQVIPAPGVFMVNHGAMGVIGFVMLHLLYGAIVGGLYNPAHTPESRLAAPRFT